LENITDPENEENPLTLRPIHELLHQLRDKFRKIYVYGELVNLLCDQGNHRAALQLEKLWHDLMKRNDFTLLCGYDMNNFREQHLEATFRAVCASHSHVNLTEARFNLPTDKDSLILLLRQHAIVLETEIERRKRVEFDLQRYLEVLSTRATESLRIQHESYRTLLSVLPVGVYSIEVMSENNDEVFVNKKFCELTGMSEAVIRVDGWERAVHPASSRARHCSQRRAEGWAVIRALARIGSASNSSRSGGWDRIANFVTKCIDKLMND